MSRAAALAAPFARVVVLRSRQAFALGALRERCARHALVLPAGPYTFPFAAALELARLFHGNDERVNPDAAGLTRAAMAQSLRAIALADVQLVAPRLDWLDASSLDLIADLLQFADLAGSRLRLLAGLPAFAPEPKLARVLALSQCADEEFDLPKSCVLNTNDRSLLAALRAAPMPLAPEKLMQVSGLHARAFNAALRKLGAAGLADAGPRIGLGAASELAPDLDLTRWREAALEVCDLPDARLSLSAALGLAGREAAPLARLALSDHEYELALARFALAPASVREPMQHALALAGCGHTQAACAILEAEQGLALERARVAAVLCTRGAMASAQAERELRAAERAERGSAGEVEVVALRAALLSAGGKHAAALKLLRRIPAGQVQAAPHAVRAAFLIEFAQGWRGAGREEKCRALLAQAQKLNLTPASAMSVELRAYESGLCSPARLAQAAARALDFKAARLALGKSRAAISALRHALGEQSAKARVISPQGPLDALELCMRHGASLAATLIESELRVLPAHAQAQAGLCAWLEAQLARAANSPGMLLPLSAPASEFKGDALLLLPALGEWGPVLAIFARPANGAALLEFVSARDVVRQWLKSGMLSTDDLHNLEDSTAENTPWPKSPPNSHPSNAPLTSP